MPNGPARCSFLRLTSKSDSPIYDMRKTRCSSTFGTSANPRQSQIERNIFIGSSNSTRTFYVGDKGSCGSAPFPSINVRDAISDLPQFEYLYEKSQSRGTQFPRFNPLKVEGTRVGFLQPIPYRAPPVNDFQTRQRDGANTIENHYTPPRTSRELDL